jgi:hypothetical protein
MENIIAFLFISIYFSIVNGDAISIESKDLNKLNKKNTILHTRQSRIKQDDLCTKPS